MASYTNSRLKGYLTLLGGFIVYLTLGTIYSYGNLTTYVTSFIRARSSPESLRYSESAWLQALGFTFQGFSMAPGGLISLRIGPKWTSLLGCGIMSAGVLLTYFTVQWSFYACIATYSFMLGTGIGLTYPSPVSCGMKWYPNHRGLVNGIALAGFGGGAFVFNWVQSYYINPENKVPDLPLVPGSNERYYSEEKARDVLDRVPSCFLLLGGLYLGLQVIGCLMLSEPKEDEETRGILLDTEKNGYIRSDIITEGRARDVSPGQMLQSKSFYLIWFMFLLNGQSVIFISSLYKAFGQTFIRNDQFLVTIGSVASLFNASGRILWGHLADKTSFRTTMVCLTASMYVFMLTFDISAYVKSKAMYSIWVFTLFFIFSGNFALFPTVTSKAYGPKYLTVNFGLVFTSHAVTGIIGAALSSTITDVLGWFGMFCLIAAFSFISMILAFVFNLRRPDGYHL